MEIRKCLCLGFQIWRLLLSVMMFSCKWQQKYHLDSSSFIHISLCWYFQHTCLILILSAFHLLMWVPLLDLPASQTFPPSPVPPTAFPPPPQPTPTPPPPYGQDQPCLSEYARMKNAVKKALFISQYGYNLLFGLAKARLKLSQSWSLSLLSKPPPPTTHHTNF